ncbi:hypothetical protein EDD18DRAFT_1101001 [Armillaria luteobubalina]|uniref:Uncharacterized protein n=1 Tax=Armillaria luteobubalina TaxID=153913 RepID=A0AA39UY09_9AGAR|nr:hypothetical protein EDD18DRAFT_1101001 [Armillaria luteobubalina]
MSVARTESLHNPTIDTTFTLYNVLSLLRVIKTFNKEYTVTELVKSYTTGSVVPLYCVSWYHPYFKFQSSMIALVSKGGHIFYLLLLQSLLDYEREHPNVIKTSAIPLSPASVLEVLLSLCDDIRFLSLIAVHYGHLFVRASSIWTEYDVAVWWEDCGITMFLHDMVSLPSTPTLMRLRVDFPDDMPDVLSLDTDIHDLHPPWGYLMCGTVSRRERGVSTQTSSTTCTYPGPEAVSMSHLYVSSHYWCPQSHTDAVAFTLCIDRLVVPSTSIQDLHSFALHGFSRLQQLEASISLVDIISVLPTLSTWTSSARGSALSELCLNMLMGGSPQNDIALAPLHNVFVSFLLGRIDDVYCPFHGKFQVILVYSEEGLYIESGVNTFESLMETMRACDDVVGVISQVEFAMHHEMYVAQISP